MIGRMHLRSVDEALVPAGILSVADGPSRPLVDAIQMQRRVQQASSR